MKDQKEHNFEFCKKSARLVKGELSQDLEPLKQLNAEESGDVVPLYTNGHLWSNIFLTRTILSQVICIIGKQMKHSF